MPRFSYKAIDARGRAHSGTMDADSAQEAIARLSAEGHLPISATPARSPAEATGWSGPEQSFRIPIALPTRKRSATIGARQLTVLTRELAHMVRSGLAVEQALQTIARTTGDTRVRASVTSIGEALRSGQSLSGALEGHGAPFDRFYISVIRAGEASGALGQALSDLAEYLRRTRAFRSSLKLAAIYPAVLVVTTVVSLAAILVFVVPQFAAMFARADGALPWHTGMILTLSDWAVSYGWVFLALVCLGGAGLLQALRTQAVRQSADRMLLSLPVAGRLVIHAETAMLCRSMGTMLRGGVSITDAFDRALPIIRNTHILSRLEALRTALRAGRGFAGPLKDTGVVPDMAAQMIAVGEESGRLDAMLMEVSELLEQDLEETTKQAMALLEPVIIITLGLVIGGIVLSIFLAIMSSYDLQI